MKLTKYVISAIAGMMLASCANSQQETASQLSEDRNEVVETIMARRSIRQYKDQPVEREKLELIAQCGINAPSAMNGQPWEVRIVDSAEFIDSLTSVFVASGNRAAEDPSFKNMFRNAPAVIFVASPKDGSGQLDCGLLGENMMLAAESLGLGTCCLGGPIRFMTTDEGARPYVEKLALPDDYELLYAIGVGYPAETPDAKPRDASKIRFID